MGDAKVCANVCAHGCIKGTRETCVAPGVVGKNNQDVCAIGCSPRLSSEC